MPLLDEARGFHIWKDSPLAVMSPFQIGADEGGLMTANDYRERPIRPGDILELYVRYADLTLQ